MTSKNENVNAQQACQTNNEQTQQSERDDHDQCACCEKQGRPVYLLRQAILPKDHFPSLAMDDNKIKFTNRKPEQALQNYQYALRTLRDGYVYVLLEKSDNNQNSTGQTNDSSNDNNQLKQTLILDAYEVIDGILRKKNPRALLGTKASPLSKACQCERHTTPSGFLGLDDSCKTAWIAYSRRPWNEQTIEHYQKGLNEQETQRFTKINLEQFKNGEFETATNYRAVPFSDVFDKNGSLQTSKVFEFHLAPHDLKGLESIHGFSYLGDRSKEYYNYATRNDKNNKPLSCAIVLEDLFGIAEELNYQRLVNCDPGFNIDESKLNSLVPDDITRDSKILDSFFTEKGKNAVDLINPKLKALKYFTRENMIKRTTKQLIFNYKAGLKNYHFKTAKPTAVNGWGFDTPFGPTVISKEQTAGTNFHQEWNDYKEVFSDELIEMDQLDDQMSKNPDLVVSLTPIEMELKEYYQKHAKDYFNYVRWLLGDKDHISKLNGTELKQVNDSHFWLTEFDFSSENSIINHLQDCLTLLIGNCESIIKLPEYRQLWDELLGNKQSLYYILSCADAKGFDTNTLTYFNLDSTSNEEITGDVLQKSFDTVDKLTNAYFKHLEKKSEEEYKNIQTDIENANEHTDLENQKELESSKLIELEQDPQYRQAVTEFNQAESKSLQSYRVWKSLLERTEELERKIKIWQLRHDELTEKAQIIEGQKQANATDIKQNQSNIEQTNQAIDINKAQQADNIIHRDNIKHKINSLNKLDELALMLNDLGNKGGAARLSAAEKQTQSLLNKSLHELYNNEMLRKKYGIHTMRTVINISKFDIAAVNAIFAQYHKLLLGSGAFSDSELASIQSLLNDSKQIIPSTKSASAVKYTLNIHSFSLNFMAELSAFFKQQKSVIDINALHKLVIKHVNEFRSQKTVVNQQKQHLQTEYEQHDKDYKQLDNEHRELQQDIEKFKQQEPELAAKNIELEQSANKNEQLLNDVEYKLDEYNQQLESLPEQIEAAHNTHVADEAVLNTKKDAKSKIGQSITQHNDSINRKIILLKAKLQDLFDYFHKRGYEVISINDLKEHQVEIANNKALLNKNIAIGSALLSVVIGGYVCYSSLNNIFDNLKKLKTALPDGDDYNKIRLLIMKELTTLVLTVTDAVLQIKMAILSIRSYQHFLAGEQAIVEEIGKKINPLSRLSVGINRIFCFFTALDAFMELATLDQLSGDGLGYYFSIRLIGGILLLASVICFWVGGPIGLIVGLIVMFLGVFLIEQSKKLDQWKPIKHWINRCLYGKNLHGTSYFGYQPYNEVNSEHGLGQLLNDFHCIQFGVQASIILKPVPEYVTFGAWIYDGMTSNKYNVGNIAKTRQIFINIVLPEFNQYSWFKALITLTNHQQQSLKLTYSGNGLKSVELINEQAIDSINSITLNRQERDFFFENTITQYHYDQGEEVEKLIYKLSTNGELFVEKVTDYEHSLLVNVAKIANCDDKDQIAEYTVDLIYRINSDSEPLLLQTGKRLIHSIDDKIEE